MRIFFISIFLSLLMLLSLIIPTKYNYNKEFDAFILNENIAIEKAIESKNFKISKRLLLDMFLTTNKNLWIKVPLKNTNDFSVNKTLVFFWTNIIFDIYYVKDKSFIKSSKKLYKNRYGLFFDHLTLDKNEKLSIYIKVTSTQKLDTLKYFDIVNTKDYTNIILNTQSYFNNGFLIGILATVLLYNILIFFSIKEKYILFYCFILFSMILQATELIPSLLTKLNIEKELIIWTIDFFYPILTLNSFILFTKYFFAVVNNRIYNTLFVIFNLLLIHAILHSESIPLYPLLIVPLFSFIGIHYLKEQKNLVDLYIFGSFFLFFPFTYYEFIIFFDLNFNYDLITTMQVSNVISSILISFSIYIRLKNISLEKDIYQKQFFLKSKYSAMGEMIANIAHQWKQPLNNLSTILINIQMNDENNTLSTKVLNSKIDNATIQINHMSNTINDFLNFFSQKKILESFFIKDVINSSLLLVSASFHKNSIQTQIDTIDNSSIKTYKNELIQVLTIILTNAKDALKMKQKNRNVYIKISQKRICIEDNAGGIDKKILDKIFDPYFSTKETKNGTGLGLYTAKVIIERNIGGSLYVENTQKGAKFTIDLNNISS